MPTENVARSTNAGPEIPTPSGWRTVLLVLGLVVCVLVFAPATPHDQRVRIRLGTGAPDVVAVTARLRRDGRVEREMKWRFDRGAPPSLEWRFEVANGPADVEVQVAGRAEDSETKRAVDLEGDEIVAELASR
jgi:hypothetical protein